MLLTLGPTKSIDIRCQGAVAWISFPSGGGKNRGFTSAHILQSLVTFKISFTNISWYGNKYARKRLDTGWPIDSCNFLITSWLAKGDDIAEQRESASATVLRLPGHI